jgi:hypothetical protein
MAVRKHANIVENGMNNATRKLDDWMTRGLSDAVKQGIDEYGFRLGVAAYSQMKRPTKNAKNRYDPWYLGLRWRRTNQLHSKPAPTGRPAEWQIKVQPQYIALWQEHGVRPHTVYNPDKARGQAFKAVKKRKTSAQNRQTKLANLGVRDKNQNRSFNRTFKTIDETERQLQGLIDTAGTGGVMGYSDPTKIPKRNTHSDWFKGKTPKATDGRRAGLSRPVMVPSGQKVQTRKFVAPIRPIYRGALRISAMHRERMAALLAQAYERRGR